MNLHPFLVGLRQNPDFLLHSFDFINRRSLVVRLEAAAYRNASFLDDRAIAPDTQGVWFPTDDLLRVMEDLEIPRPPHFIFHVSHCGSTLLSRLLAELRGVHPVREPLTLLSLAMHRRELERPASLLDEAGWEHLLTLTLALLARTYREDDRAMIKATSACCNLAGLLLGRHPESRALALHVSLETYLAMMLRMEQSRENGRFYSQAWLMDLHALTGRTDIRLATLSDVERFTVNWLAAVTHLLHAADEYPERFLLLDFDAFLVDPSRKLTEDAGLFGLDTEDVPRVLQGPLMRSYSKRPGEPFDATVRRREIEKTRQHAGKEIDQGLAFAERLCRDVSQLAPAGRYLRDAS